MQKSCEDTSIRSAKCSDFLDNFNEFTFSMSIQSAASWGATLGAGGRGVMRAAAGGKKLEFF